MNLYEIDSMYQLLLQEAREYAEEHDGEIPGDIAEKLEKIELCRTDKIMNTLRYYKNENATSIAIMSEIAILEKRLKTHENNVEFAKSLLLRFVNPGEKIEFPIGKISWRNSTSVTILDAQRVPEKYMRIIPEKSEPDKNAIGFDIRNGGKVDGCELTSKQTIQIK